MLIFFFLVPMWVKFSFNNNNLYIDGNILLAAIERLDSQRFDVDDRRFESPG